MAQGSGPTTPALYGDIVIYTLLAAGQALYMIWAYCVEEKHMNWPFILILTIGIVLFV
jgi:hypothetical protein